MARRGKPNFEPKPDRGWSLRIAVV